MKKLLSFLRWRIVLVRYLTMVSNFRWFSCWKSYKASSKIATDIEVQGLHLPEKIDDTDLKELQEIFTSRGDKVIPKAQGAPFVNLVQPSDFTVDNPMMRLAFSKKIFDAANDYFGGHFILDSLQVLYSWPTSGSLRESQMWHKDYGDSKTFHAIIYLNDVTKVEDGPFVFVSKQDTRNINYSPLVRRIDDKTFLNELKDGTVQYFYATAGNIVLVDPAACYHYGSRCKNARTAIFITFNTSMPFCKPQDMIIDNATLIADVAKKLRPDLSEAFLDRIIIPS